MLGQEQRSFSREAEALRCARRVFSCAKRDQHSLNNVERNPFDVTPISDVVPLGTPFKIFSSVIGFGAGFVVDVSQSFGVRQPCQSNKSMNFESPLNPMVAKDKLPIPCSIPASSKVSAALCAANHSRITDLIKSFVSGDISPIHGEWISPFHPMIKEA